MTTTRDGIRSAADWRKAARSRRASRAETLELPSGTTILAARPEPLEWILAGRLPQRLLAAALGESQSHFRENSLGHPRESGDPALDSRLRGNDVKEARGYDGSDDGARMTRGDAGAGMTREDVLELARFAAQLVRASVVEPAIGEGPDEISLDDIPIEDRAFIFEWACRALGESGTSAAKEGLSSPLSDGLERFCAQ